METRYLSIGAPAEVAREIAQQFANATGHALDVIAKADGTIIAVSITGDSAQIDAALAAAATRWPGVTFDPA